jgi:hypothetical protein
VKVSDLAYMETDTDGNRSESTESSKKLKEPRKSQKTMFIIPYRASGPYISPTMLLELSKIEADDPHVFSRPFAWNRVDTLGTEHLGVVLLGEVGDDGVLRRELGVDLKMW